MDNEEKDSNDQPIHQPEYILLEAEETMEKQTRSEQERRQMFETLKRLGSQRFPWSIHFIVLGALFLISLAACLCLLYLLLTFVLAALVLFQSSSMNKLLNKAWRAFKRAAVMILGFSIAIFSPPFGFSVILLYFLLHNDEVEGPFFTRFFQSRFTQF